MKKRDVLAAGIILLLAVITGVVSRLRADDPETLVITVDGSVFGTYDLNTDQTIEINDTNVCVIADGVVSMTEADCPDQICVHTASISTDGGTIVCLPNRVVLEIKGDDPEDSDETLPDSISS